jgi:hypothetical protein
LEGSGIASEKQSRLTSFRVLGVVVFVSGFYVRSQSAAGVNEGTLECTVNSFKRGEISERFREGRLRLEGRLRRTVVLIV